MACPHIAGAVSLIWSSSLNLNKNEIVNILYNSATIDKNI